VEEVGKILPVVLRRQVRRNEAMLVEVLAPLWPCVVGKGIAQQSRPAAFAAGTLTLATSCPSWAAQLRQMSDQVCARVNNYLGATVVKKLRVELVLNVDAPGALTTPEKPVPGPENSFPCVPEGAGHLEPEMSKILEQSFGKYFARPKTKVHGWH